MAIFQPTYAKLIFWKGSFIAKRGLIENLLLDFSITGCTAFLVGKKPEFYVED